MKKIIIAAGGTGGHINPALAFADAVKEKNPECDILFIGSSDRMEADIIPAHGYRFLGMDIESTYGGYLNKVRSVLSIFKAQKELKKKLKEWKPDACIGFGNYISVPLIMAAHSLHIPTMIHEQNSFAGKANRMLGRYADAIVGCYDLNKEQFPAERIRIYGNPEATAAGRLIPGHKVKEYGLDPSEPFVLFMMGSLGSSSVAEVLDHSCGLFDDSYQVLIVAGKSNDYEFTTAGSRRIRIVPYVDGAAMLQEAALSVTRAGATTIAEITALGAASVLIPSPYVPNNHQFFNADELVKRGAAVMLEEKDLNPESLSGLVNELMKDENRRKELQKHSEEMGKKNAAYDMISWLEELTDHD